MATVSTHSYQTNMLLLGNFVAMFFLAILANGSTNIALAGFGKTQVMRNEGTQVGR